MPEYLVKDIQHELETVKIKLVENARLQLVAVKHSPLVNKVLHRSTLNCLKEQAELLHGYEHALEKLLPWVKSIFLNLQDEQFLLIAIKESQDQTK